MNHKRKTVQSTNPSISIYNRNCPQYQQFRAFKKRYKKNAQYNVSYQEQSESEVSNTRYEELSSFVNQSQLESEQNTPSEGQSQKFILVNQHAPPIQIEVPSEPEDSTSISEETDTQSQLEWEQNTPPKGQSQKIILVSQNQNNKAKSAMTILFPQTPEDSSQSSEETDKVENIPILRSCKCKRSQCLKRYCSCFNNGIGCGIECKCEDCKNKEDFQPEVDQAIENIIDRAIQINNPNLENLFNPKKVDNCNCLGNCEQNYCECHKINQKCTQKCNCDRCENGKDDDFQLPQIQLPQIQLPQIQLPQIQLPQIHSTSIKNQGKNTQDSIMIMIQLSQNKIINSINNKYTISKNKIYLY